MLSQARRFLIFAALASLLTLLPVGPAASQATGCKDASGQSDWDCDGVTDQNDQFPNDPNESRDSDGDTIGDNADNCPTQPAPGTNGAQSPDLDGDGKGDPCDDDRDGDGVDNWRDAYPDDGSRKWHQPAGWADYTECERQYYDTHGNLEGNDCDGDGVTVPSDQCPRYGPAYGSPPTASDGCQDPAGPDGDTDRDGVVNGKDRCPAQGAGTGGLDAYGCPVAADRDRDGWPDHNDDCPGQPTNQYSDASLYGRGCPGRAPFSEPDTPAASGPSCTKKRPCVVLERRGLSQKQNGGYIDADAVVKVTIARDARGVPARVMAVQFKNVDSRCSHWDAKSRTYSSTPGSEVSVTLDSPLALKKRRQRHGGGGSSVVFTFDPIQPIRTIKGVKYELSFGMYEADDASKAEFSISTAGAIRPGACYINVNGYNDPVTDGFCRTDGRGVEEGACEAPEIQSIDSAYKYGQALYLDCGVSFRCPAAKNVDVKATVSKSVAKVLGLTSTTVAGGDAVGPKRVNLDDEKKTYYFVPLRADAERKMKAKEVRSITVTVSGTATGPDGIRRFAARVDWSFDGNCSGRDLKITRHLTYGGTCSRR